jgi:hypothetical protein
VEFVMKNTIVGVDLAKNAIQVCVFTNKKVRSNTEMTPLGTRQAILYQSIKS